MRQSALFIANQAEGAVGGLLWDALRFARAVLRSVHRRSDMAKLREFDDHQLADIGITRDDLSWALTLPFSHDPSVALQERALRRRARGWRG